VVSITRQTLWACDGTQSVNTSPVTTGAGSATPTGTFYIQAKEGPQYLNGCNDTGCWHDYVHVWIPFDGSYGFHDAPWQTMPFGSPDYMTEGSHGCVHLPAAESNWVFNWVAVGTAVTIEA
jgi:lipoprotein-anchoring transpeptidase ErfK/SrfK